jgi:hypothetical protein
MGTLCTATHLRQPRAFSAVRSSSCGQSSQLVLGVAIAVCALFTSLPCLAQSKEAIDAGVEKAVRQFNELDPRHAKLKNSAVRLGFQTLALARSGAISLSEAYRARLD